MIGYGRQLIDEADINAVLGVLQSDWLTQGPNVVKFEDAINSAVGSKHAIAVNSATSALHLAYLALDVGPGDIVWMAPNTFVATANAALYCGAQVDFVDIDPNSYNLSVNALKSKLGAAKLNNKLPKVVVPVHFAGLPCDMQAIAALAAEYGFAVVEDASHALGAKYHDSLVGSCKYSQITIFSFHPVKIITTGEGGMLTTNDNGLAQKIQQLRSHGITRDANEFKFKMDGRWGYQQIGLGFNYRMPDINAILGASQLTKLEQFIRRRNQIALIYQHKLKGARLEIQQTAIGYLNAYHLFVILTQDERQRKALDAYLLENNISCNVHYYPVYLQPYYRSLGFTEGLCPVAENYAQRCLSLPIYPGLQDEQILHITQLVYNFLCNNV
jgi:UDP-4-amino-4,6-dideoxy-N-acetyl-beta-L-altrosamine transaminase